MPTIFEDVLRIVRHREAAARELDDARQDLRAAEADRDRALAMIATLDAELAKYLPLTVADLIRKLDTKEELPADPAPAPTK